MEYDAIVIGAGPAGLSAALYLARRKVKTILISHNIGGQIMLSGKIENYLGFSDLSGIELVKNFQNHLKNYELEKMIGPEVEKIEKGDNKFIIHHTNGKSVTARSVVITAGQTPRKLKIPGEKEFEKKGVAFCATCDAPLYANKDVAVIGGGNSALDSALQLEKYANNVYLINLNADFIGESVRVDKINKSKKIEVIQETETKEIKGKDFVQSIVVENRKNKKKREIAVSGVFIEIGSLPATGFLTKTLKLNEKGEIIIDKKNRTSTPGIFAAGDITDVPYKQIIIAAGEGGKAALSAAEYLHSSKN